MKTLINHILKPFTELVQTPVIRLASFIHLCMNEEDHVMARLEE